jgi:hypothetical protein
MSELLSSMMLKGLRESANKLARPAERHATLDRLVEACDAIAGGEAHATLMKANSDAEIHFRRRPTLVKPPRVEEYVYARRVIDVTAKRPSAWTGPIATTIRKDAGLLEYVRAREQEQIATVPGKVTPSVDQTLDMVEDMALRAQLRFILAKARRAEQDLRRLKEGMRKLRPTIDLEQLMAGHISTDRQGLPAQPLIPAVLGDSPDREAILLQALTAVMKLSTPGLLSKCGLELSVEFGNVVERKTRFELITADELSALRSVTGAK